MLNLHARVGNKGVRLSNVTAFLETNQNRIQLIQLVFTGVFWPVYCGYMQGCYIKALQLYSFMIYVLEATGVNYRLSQKK
jgi:hypothetical protein